jgi:hypothetical protein
MTATGRHRSKAAIPLSTRKRLFRAVLGQSLKCPVGKIAADTFKDSLLKGLRAGQVAAGVSLNPEIATHLDFQSERAYLPRWNRSD